MPSRAKSNASSKQTQVSAIASASAAAFSSAIPGSGLLGNVEAIDSEGIRGWVYDFSNPARQLTLQVYINGLLAATTTRTLWRQFSNDDGENKPILAGFFVPWREVTLTSDVNCTFVRVVVVGTNYVLPMLNQQMAPGSVTPVKKEAPAQQPPVKGNFEAVNSSTLAVSGWAYQPNHEVPLNLEVYVNDVKCAEGAATVIRPDLLDVCGTHQSGFNFVLTPENFTQVINKVSVKANGQELAGSPKVLSFSNKLKLDEATIKNGELTCELHGWKGGPLKAYLMVDGRARGIATFNRDDSGKVTCQYPIPGLKADGTAHVYQVVLPGVQADPVTLRWPEYEFALDIVNFDRITGWAFARGQGPLSLELRPLHEGEPALGLRGDASVPREDVKAAHGLVDARCGFDFSLNVAAQSQLSFELRDVKTQVELGVIDIANDYDASLAAARQSANSSAAGGYRKVVLPAQTAKLSGETRHVLQRFPQTAKPASERGVTVIVPIYGGAVETTECLESVFQSKNETPYELLLINDCSPEPLINKYLAHVAKRNLPHVMIINRCTNKGFSEAVNVGVTASGDNDVILLNADTVVSDGWVDKMLAAARKTPHIGTLTPLSNNGELATVPYICKTLPINSHDVAKQIDRTAEACNPGKLVDMPVGIGFCMYINRDCLNEVGLFDAAKWGRGYGEEVDFCLKAAHLGWRNVLLADTFVVHRGNVSFGNEKMLRVLESAKKIAQMYPFYDTTIQRYLAADPFRPARRTLNLNLIASGITKQKTLHVTHAFGGGTDTYVRTMLTLTEEAGGYAVLLQLDAKGNAELTFDMSQHPLSAIFEKKHVERYALREQSMLLQDLKTLGFEDVHLHAIFGMSPAFLTGLTEAFSYDITVHDYAWLCPRVTMTTPEAKQCRSRGQDTNQCQNCLNSAGAHPGLSLLLDPVEPHISSYTRALKSIMANARNVYVGAQCVADNLVQAGFKGAYRHKAHPAERKSVFHKTMAPRPAQGPIKVAVIGAISDIKGFYQLLSLTRYCQERSLPIEFQVFGYTMNDSLLRDMPNVKLLGMYKENELDELILQYQPSMALFLNQCSETFSYTLSHAIRLGLWPVVTDIGAPAERIRELYSVGTIIPVESSAESVASTLFKVRELLQEQIEWPVIQYPMSLAEYRS